MDTGDGNGNPHAKKAKTTLDTGTVFGETNAGVGPIIISVDQSESMDGAGGPGKAAAGTGAGISAGDDAAGGKTEAKMSIDIFSGRAGPSDAVLETEKVGFTEQGPVIPGRVGITVGDEYQTLAGDTTSRGAVSELVEIGQAKNGGVDVPMGIDVISGGLTSTACLDEKASCSVLISARTSTNAPSGSEIVRVSAAGTVVGLANDQMTSVDSTSHTPSRVDITEAKHTVFFGRNLCDSTTSDVRQVMTERLATYERSFQERTLSDVPSFLLPKLTEEHIKNIALKRDQSLREFSSFPGIGGEIGDNEMLEFYLMPRVMGRRDGFPPYFHAEVEFFHIPPWQFANDHTPGPTMDLQWIVFNKTKLPKNTTRGSRGMPEGRWKPDKHGVVYPRRGLTAGEFYTNIKSWFEDNVYDEEEEGAYVGESHDYDFWSNEERQLTNWHLKEYTLPLKRNFLNVASSSYSSGSLSGKRLTHSTSNPTGKRGMTRASSSSTGKRSLTPSSPNGRRKSLKTP